MTPQELREIYHDNFDMYPEDAPPELAVEKVLPEDRQWVPIMSDTPAEIVEHALALNNATGNVLITGLGLGCLPHALLSKPDVTRIDIIEIDPDVIELTGAYFIDPRVHIHQGSAADLSAVPADLRWDYAWHDIWSHISARNLNPRPPSTGSATTRCSAVATARERQTGRLGARPRHRPAPDRGRRGAARAGLPRARYGAAAR
jgi:hypothetical protein